MSIDPDTKPVLTPIPGGFGGNFALDHGDDIHNRALAWLKTIPYQSGDQVIDLGCGFGGFTLKAAQTHHVVTGIDITPECAVPFRKTMENADAQFRTDIIIGNMAEKETWQKTSIPPGSAIAVMAFRSLIWMPVDDLKKTLTHAHQALQPSGRLWFSILSNKAPCISDHQNCLPVEKRHGVILPKYQKALNMLQPVTPYNLEEWNAILTASGFNLVEGKTHKWHIKGCATKA
ncbi:MAG: hypothetical protein COY40_05005 [Alphaproteobacteria bacterium CG_4_10_14_0_8_um_filter_53_9]|nr:MAG: hypothetical protein COY40_05005 [Alphaproteobacteria bacterium CG_4_10_14_0_8_um_filter_53_9]